ncbi:MAG: triose-phosphate isomerase [Desulfurococcales archaeon]|nr:triose-phosphate isomerase [Desulfurococcales archaeon]
MSVERLVLAVNLKAYPQAFTRYMDLAREARLLSERLSRVRIILAVPAPLVYPVGSVYDDVYLQHVDSVDYGSHTGYLPARAVEHLPVKGTLLNHSEHKITYRSLAKAAQEVKAAGKEVLICADTPTEAAAVALLGPTMVAVEPPELIGTGIPVSRAKPEVITSAVEAVKRVAPQVPLLAGAGISSPEDAVKAIELGARGVLVASHIVKAHDPAERLRRMAEAVEEA